MYDKFKNQYSQEEADEILGPDTDHDDQRRVSVISICYSNEAHLNIEWTHKSENTPREIHWSLKTWWVN